MRRSVLVLMALWLGGAGCAGCDKSPPCSDYCKFVGRTRCDLLAPLSDGQGKCGERCRTAVTSAPECRAPLERWLECAKGFDPNCPRGEDYAVFELCPALAAEVERCFERSARRGCPPGPPPTPEATVDAIEIARERCAFWGRCHPQALQGYSPPTAEGCAGYVACTHERGAGPTVTPACLEALRGLDCSGSFEAVSTSRVCERAGPVPEAKAGEACGHEVCRGETAVRSVVTCGPGLFCSKDQVCQPYLAPGAPCVLDERDQVLLDACPPGSFCDQTEHRCRERLAAGAACTVQASPGGLEVDPCVFAHACEEGRCQLWLVTAPAPPSPLPPSEGQACNPEADPPCLLGLACVEGRCQRLQCGGQVGAPCDGESCAEGLVCHSATRRCAVCGVPCDKGARR